MAVFDTAFHATLPRPRRRTPCRAAGGTSSGIRRYGFHGISSSGAAERVPELLGVEPRRPPHGRLPPRRRLLGDRDPRGRAGRHVDGLQPARGRPDGDAAGLDRRRDPALPAAQRAADPRGDRARPEPRIRPERAVRADRRRRASWRIEPPTTREALFALELFAHRVAAAVAAAATSLGRVDAVVFTGGIGEHASLTRVRICARLHHFGVALDERANAIVEEGEIGAAESATRVVIVRSAGGAGHRPRRLRALSGSGSRASALADEAVPRPAERQRPLVDTREEHRPTRSRGQRRSRWRCCFSCLQCALGAEGAASAVATRILRLYRIRTGDFTLQKVKRAP